jgi:hypothetical protein
MTRRQGEGELERGRAGEGESGRERERGRELDAKKPGFRLVMPLKLASCLPSISEL